MSGNDLLALHAKMDRMVESTSGIDKRLACLETLKEAQKGRCDSHAESIESLEGTVLGNGKPGLTTLIAQLSGRIDTLAATMKEKFTGLTREMAIYVVIGAAITSLLVTSLVGYAASRWNQKLDTEIKQVGSDVRAESVKNVIRDIR